MKKSIKYAGLLFMLIFALVLGANIHFDISPEDLNKRYTDSQSKFLDINGIQVHYKDEGSGRVMVLLHGTGASLHTWDEMISALDTGYRVVRLDLPGFGLTGPNSDANYSIESYADFLNRFLKKLGIQKCTLVGNSLGGNIAWYYASMNLIELEGLVLIAPSGAGLDRDLPLVIRMARSKILSKLLRYLTPESFVRKNLEEVYYNDSLVTDDLVRRYHDMTLRKGNRHAFIHRARTKRLDDTEKLADIKIPCFLIWGENDLWVDPTDSKVFIDGIINIQTVFMPETGHVPMEERPKETAEYIAAFLDTL